MVRIPSSPRSSTLSSPPSSEAIPVPRPAESSLLLLLQPGTPAFPRDFSERFNLFMLGRVSFCCCLIAAILQRESLGWALPFPAFLYLQFVITSLPLRSSAFENSEAHWMVSGVLGVNLVNIRSCIAM